MNELFRGPLRPCAANPRYFSDETGKAIYLTGSHTWTTFQDGVGANAAPALDYGAYLDFMQAHDHNFLRLWCMESVSGGPFGERTDPVAYCEAPPGPDGHRRYDLTQLNPAYFERLADRVEQAAARGIYVSVMLFEGWSVDTRAQEVWHGHPYCKENNVNGIDGNPHIGMPAALSGENDCNPFAPQEHILVHTLVDPKITALQKVYVRRVVETLNHFDNVLYEICNEALRWSRYWQYEMIDFIHETERSMAKQHPVWMSHLVPAQNESLWMSHAEAISPGEESTASPYCIDPPANESGRVIFADTDHLGGIWGTPQWVWKCFLRGLNPIFMDPFGNAVAQESAAQDGLQSLFGRMQYGLPEDWQEQVRTAMGQTRRFAVQMNLNRMVPADNISSTRYCLADPGREYLVYQPECGQFKLKLYGARGPFSVEWFDPFSGTSVTGPAFAGGTAVDFTPPFHGEAVLHLRRLDTGR